MTTQARGSKSSKTGRKENSSFYSKDNLGKMAKQLFSESKTQENLDTQVNMEVDKE